MSDPRSTANRNRDPAAARWGPALAPRGVWRIGSWRIGRFSTAALARIGQSCDSLSSLRLRLAVRSAQSSLANLVPQMKLESGGTRDGLSGETRRTGGLIGERMRRRCAESDRAGSTAGSLPSSGHGTRERA